MKGIANALPIKYPHEQAGITLPEAGTLFLAEEKLFLCSLCRPHGPVPAVSHGKKRDRQTFLDLGLLYKSTYCTAAVLTGTVKLVRAGFSPPPTKKLTDFQTLK